MKGDALFVFNLKGIRNGVEMQISKAEMPGRDSRSPHAMGTMLLSALLVNFKIMNKSATFSACRKYRYTLWRCWEGLFWRPGYVMFIGLNPSTADETNDDPTIRRCIRYTRDWDYSGLCMTNLFAFRATSPDDMKAVDNPIGPDNNRTLIDMAEYAEVVVAAWGNDGAYRERGETVGKMIPNLSYLKLTKNGFPAHPLRLPKGLKPILWKE